MEGDSWIAVGSAWREEEGLKGRRGPWRAEEKLGRQSAQSRGQMGVPRKRMRAPGNRGPRGSWKLEDKGQPRVEGGPGGWSWLQRVEKVAWGP